MRNGLFPQQLSLYCFLLIKTTCLSKTKMVRMVHRNLFYNTDLNVAFLDEKRKLWWKIESLEGANF